MLSLTPVRVFCAVLLVAFGCLLGAGCSTIPNSGSGDSSASGEANFRRTGTITIDVPIGTTTRATIYVNGQLEGATPVHLRLQTDELGMLLEDVTCSAEWSDGTAETSFVLRRGTRPSPIVRVSKSGMVEF